MPRGGARPGSGRPKGSKIPATLVKEAVEKARLRKVACDAQRIIDEMALVALSNIKSILKDDGSLKPLSELTDAEAACISSYEVNSSTDADGRNRTVTRIKLWDKPKTLELLGKTKSLGLFSQEKERPQVLVLVGQGSVAIGPSPWDGQPTFHGAALLNDPRQALALESAPTPQAFLSVALAPLPAQDATIDPPAAK